MTRDKGQSSLSCPFLLFTVILRVPWTAGIQQETGKNIQVYVKGECLRKTASQSLKLHPNSKGKDRQWTATKPSLPAGDSKKAKEMLEKKCNPQMPVSSFFFQA